MQFYHYSFRPKLISTLATLAAITVMIMLGQWQSSKATQKQSMQDTYDARTTQMAERITPDELNAEAVGNSRSKMRKSVPVILSSRCSENTPTIFRLLPDAQVRMAQEWCHSLKNDHIMMANAAAKVKAHRSGCLCWTVWRNDAISRIASA